MINTTALEKLWNNGLLDREIAEKLKCACLTVQKWRKKNDLPSNAGIFNWGDEKANGKAKRV